jgi:hypothetical protein
MTYLAQSATVFQLQGQHKVKLFNERWIWKYMEGSGGVMF